MRRIALMLGVMVVGFVVSAVTLHNLATEEPTAEESIETRVNDLLSRMTTEEKLQQVQLLSDGQMLEDGGLDGEKAARAGVGGVFSLTDPTEIRRYQRIAVEESRLGIPILFAYDTIHGYRTIFPVPLGAASSFDPAVARTDARIGARESSTVGLKQIYSPMVDVSHEPRWGRIVEGGGEDPYLNSVMGVARVKGAQGNDYSATDKVVTSPKHYVAYGEPEGGRDYNTTDMSEQRLRNMHLPPFKATIDAGADTVMCSFNSINGVPGCANRYTETDILKKEWGFDGFIESDYTAVAETRACPPLKPGEGPCGHGTAADGPDAAANALMAGTDQEMVSTFIRDYGQQLLDQDRISMSRLNDAVRRILRVKFRAGLFERPYVDQSEATDPDNFLTDEDRAAARKAAGRSMVLLKNKDQTLPLDPNKTTAVIGPLGGDDARHDMLGPWWGRGDDNSDDEIITPFEGIAAQSDGATFTEGCELSHLEPPDYDPSQDCNTNDFSAAINAAEAADQVVLTLGETREMSGEAASRSEIDLPGNQEGLIRAIEATGKPFAVVLFNGRPLDLTEVAGDSPAILEAWFPGVAAGDAVADVVFGKVNPGGKLPVSFPQKVGQVPIYYNHEPTGRPCDVTQKYVSRYRDLKTCDPFYPFGYGLSYTRFSISNLSLDSRTMSATGGGITATVDVTNTGSRRGDEVVQLYIHDPVASISQPVRRLRDFKRINLDAGETKQVQFTIDRSDVGFYDNSGQFVVEPGKIELYVGNSSKGGRKTTFTVTR